MHKRFLLELTGIGSIGVKWALSLGMIVVDFLFCLTIFFKKIENSSFYPDVPTTSIITYWTCKFTLALPDSCQVSSRALPISSLFWNFGTKALFFASNFLFFSPYPRLTLQYEEIRPHTHLALLGVVFNFHANTEGNWRGKWWKTWVKVA